MRRLIKCYYISLPILIADSEIIPELILHNCTVDAISDQLSPLLRETPQREAQLKGYEDMRARLGSSTAAVKTAGLIVEALGCH